jgi:hypothetical protein
VSEPAAEAPLNRRMFAAGLVIGGAFIAFGIYSLLRKPVVPRDFLVWFGGGIVVHDLVAAPAVFVLGWALRRVLPRWALAPVQAGLIASALLIVFTLPAYGVQHNPGNLSRLPNEYLRNLAGILALVWVAVLGGLVHARRNRRA